MAKDKQVPERKLSRRNEDRRDVPPPKIPEPKKFKIGIRVVDNRTVKPMKKKSTGSYYDRKFHGSRAKLYQWHWSNHTAMKPYDALVEAGQKFDHGAPLARLIEGFRCRTLEAVIMQDGVEMPLDIDKVLLDSPQVQIDRLQRIHSLRTNSLFVQKLQELHDNAKDKRLGLKVGATFAALMQDLASLDEQAMAKLKELGADPAARDEDDDDDDDDDMERAIDEEEEEDYEDEDERG